MDERDWNILLNIIKQGNCILMLGPEIPAGCKKGDHKSLIEVLANEIADEMADVLPEDFNRNTLAQVAQRFCAQESKSDLQYIAESFFKKQENLHCEIHSNLASLPFYLIINASHDNLFVEALKAHNKEFEIVFYNFRGGKEEIDVKGRTEKPLVYYLYGHPQNLDSLVLSENDLLDFLVAVISKNPPLPSYLTSEFSDKDKCFLFLGFGFQNWYLRILLHVLQGGSRKGRSFAMEEFVNEKDQHFKNAVFFFRDEYKIKFFTENIGDFATELKRRFDILQKESPEPRDKNVCADQPSVFICHASEDKEFARQMYDKLKAGNLNPWLDKENIRGGDLWDPLIQETIEEIDYFVVVQSKAMADKIEGYVNMEVDLAIKRQQKLRRPFKFIVPIQIEECAPLEALKDWQTIDFRESDKTGELISVINRDRQRRSKM